MHLPPFRHAASLPLALAALAFPFAAQATDGYFLNGTGAKAKGMGGAEIALPQDALAISTNPAAATELGHRLDLGFELFVPDRGTRISGNFAGLNGTWSGNGSNPFLLPEAGYVRPVSNSVSLGIAINGNGGMNTQYKANPFGSFGARGPAGVNLRQIQIAPTVAVKLAEGQSIGISPVIVIQSFTMHGIQPFAGYSADPARVSNRGTDWSTGVGLRIGYLATITSGVRLGAFYQSKIDTSRFKRYAGLFAGRGGFDVPPQWGAGLSVDATPAVTLAADFKHIGYSKVRSVGNPIAPLFAGKPFGAVGGPGFGWRDVSVWKLGASWKASPGLVLRAGYGRSENPVPRSQTLLNILAPGVVRGHITAGATVKLDDAMELTAYAMRAPRQTVHGQGSIPLPFGGGEADVHLAETAFGASFGYTF